MRGLPSGTSSGAMQRGLRGRGVARAAPGGQGKANGEFILGRPPVVTGKGLFILGFPRSQSTRPSAAVAA